jgi:hypothetical protein
MILRLEDGSRVLECLRTGCKQMCALADEQVACIETLTAGGGDAQRSVPLHDWRFFMWEGELVAVCPEDAKLLPEPDKVEPVMNGARA